MDETGITTETTRAHARAPRGERAFAGAPGGHRERVTVIGALGAEGLTAAMSIPAATSTEVFLAFVDRVLVPALAGREPKATVVLDNLNAHKDARVRERLEAAGHGLRFLPRYSPDLSPIEPCWSKLKALLRGKEARSVEALDHELPGILDAISAQDAAGRFHHCGYELRTQT